MKEIKKFQNKVQFFFRPIKMRNRKFGKGTLDESLDEVELIENTKNFDRIYNETKVTPFESNISVFLGYFSIIMLLNFFFFNYSLLECNLHSCSSCNFIRFHLDFGICF
jgi:hypothetical protein